MAEAKITDLPAITIEDFTANDSFLIVDDGMARRLTNSVFLVWLQDNVKGEKGDQGVAGRDGLKGKDGVSGRDGVDGLDAFQLAVREGFIGTIGEWFNTFKGASGEDGTDGGDGWSPVFEIDTVANGSYIKIVDWIGGTGVKPDTLGYLSEQGVVGDILLATNIIGSKGDKGDIGLKGDRGVKGDKGDDGEQGLRGYDAYELAVLEGFSGTREEWLASLNPSEVSAEEGNIITKKIDGMYAPATDPLTMANAIDALPDKNIMTDAQKEKLESIKTSMYLGTFLDIESVPTEGIIAGNYADVDAGVGQDVERYIYDETDSKFVKMSSDVVGEKGDTILDVNTGLPLKVWTGTQSEYDSVAVKDPQTLYMVK